MKVFTALVALAVSATGALAQGLTVNTPPSGVVCQPLLITWTGGTPPYFLSILPGGQPTAPALVDFGNIGDAQSHRWPSVNLPAGTQVGINLRDSTGALAQSAPFPINAGSDTGCLTSTSTSSSSTSSGTSTSTTRTTSGSTSSTSTTSTSTTATTPTPTTTRTTTTPTTSSTTTTPPPATSSNVDNGASKLGQISFVGAVGAAAAIFLA